MLAHIHSQLSKPLLDVVLMTGQLWLLDLGKQKRAMDNIAPSILTVAVICICLRAGETECQRH
jgi:hypothetical protein